MGRRFKSKNDDRYIAVNTKETELYPDGMTIIIEPDKNLHVVSAPDTVDEWPVPPVYEPLVSYEDLEIMSARLPGTSIEVIQLWLAYGIVNKYNKALSEAQFEIWQLKGLLNDRFKSLVREQDHLGERGDGGTGNPGVRDGPA